MSLPQEQLDQLVSGYLDDALSDDDRARVEALLESDPSIADELESFRRLRSSLGELLRADRRSLGSGFADRVLEAAVDRAQTEGLADEHPLVRLSEQPAARSPRRDPPRGWRVAAAVLAMAASVALAIGLWNVPASDPAAGDREIAEVPGGLGQDATGQGDPAGDADRAVAITDPGESAGSDDASPRSNGTPREKRSVAASELGGSPERSTDPESGAGRIADPSAVAEAIAETPGRPGRREMAEADPRRSPGLSVDAAAAADAGVGAILVVEVRRTEYGKARPVVRRAMRQAGIGSAAEKQLSDELVTAVTESVESPESIEPTEASILYLQAPAKRLDQLLMTLAADQQGIAAVGWSIAFEAPILDVVRSVGPVEPTDIRHAASLELQGRGADVGGRLAGALAAREFLPVRPSGAAGGGGIPQIAAAAGSDSGSDVMAQVLLLVR